VSEDLDRIFERFENLARHRDSPAGVLSGGEQQMLALGRALMSRPRLLLLDEPSMGLAPIMVGRIYEVLADLVSQGTTMLLVEQNVSRALQVADSIYALKSGQFVASRLAADSLSVSDLVQGYLQELGTLATPHQVATGSTR
jgi:branched-chain amino acid transport system ATP-binding protein